MLPRLQAEERLVAFDDRVLAGGRLGQFDAERALDRLQSAARGVAPERPAPASAATLARMGIGIVTAPSEPVQTAVNDG